MASKWFTNGTIRRVPQTKTQVITKDGQDIIITETFVHRLESDPEKTNFRTFLENRRDSLDPLKEIPEYTDAYNAAVSDLTAIS